MSGLLSSLNRDNIDTVLTQTLSDSRGNVSEILVSRLLTAAVLLKSDRALATAFSTVTRLGADPVDRTVALLRLAAIWEGSTAGQDLRSGQGGGDAGNPLRN